MDRSQVPRQTLRRGLRPRLDRGDRGRRIVEVVVGRGGGPGAVRARDRGKRAARPRSGAARRLGERFRLLVALERRLPLRWRNGGARSVRREFASDGGDSRIELAGAGAGRGPFVQSGSGHLHRGGRGLSSGARPGRPGRRLRIPLRQSGRLQDHARATHGYRRRDASRATAGGARSSAALSALCTGV